MRYRVANRRSECCIGATDFRQCKLFSVRLRQSQRIEQSYYVRVRRRVARRISGVKRCAVRIEADDVHRGVTGIEVGERDGCRPDIGVKDNLDVSAFKRVRQARDVLKGADEISRIGLGDSPRHPRAIHLEPGPKVELVITGTGPRLKDAVEYRIFAAAHDIPERLIGILVL